MKKIITISREFGSGGRTIGKQVAERLGVACYDKELIEKIAEETGFARDFVRKEDEEAPSRNRFAYSFLGRGIKGLSTEDYLWTAQWKIIQEIAEKEPCVIVGRCADYILKERTDCLNVFIHADIEKRAERIVRLYGETNKSPYKRLKEKDKKRSINYQYYTEQEWGMSQNYHLSLNSGAIGIDKCVNIIAEIAEGMAGTP